MGFSLPEFFVFLLILVSVTAIAAPTAFELQAALAVRSAAGEVRAALYYARAQAIQRCRNVGLKFRRNGDRYEWTLYVDGNGNGIRTAEITKGIDKPLGLAVPWGRGDVFPGILTGVRVPDPGSPGKFLIGANDPIRFNSSDICSFSPVGESTPGSIYLWDGRDRMAVIRVFGRTAKVRTLFYRRGDKEWKP
ncbi:MAG TPA: GspH/FimT family pseudopilin [Thermoanaerobaculia bacterium]|nr:GspH/FimT family pseudopilin [Thermoanaerobaculia bacterium]HMF09969.1 GspH/FimT family pseudopilin [Thermoanaerobaculia bacterium]